MNFREEVLERLRLRLGEADVPGADLEAFVSDVIHLLDRLTRERAYDATVRQILQRFASEWSENQSRRLIEGPADAAAGMVYEMLARQGRTRASEALRRALFDAIEGRERPLDDLDFFEET